MAKKSKKRNKNIQLSDEQVERINNAESVDEKYAIREEILKKAIQKKHEWFKHIPGGEFLGTIVLNDFENIPDDNKLKINLVKLKNGVALNKIDWTSYLECYRGLLIAPAGQGKTTAIADCIMQYPDDSCHLILTHTHAGIASLRVKLNKKKVPKNKYQIDTITGFAQRYVLSFEGNEDLPKTEDKSYFSTVVQHCTKLLNSAPIQLVIKATYNGIFVDEYQDCTIEQHEMILLLAKNLPLHVLGDSLQGIFSFEKTPLVNFERELSDFQVYDCLKYPWRWHDTNEELGSLIFSMRQCLETHKPILLDEISCNGLTVVHHSMPADLHNPSFLKLLRLTIKSNIDDSFLIIYPSYNEPLKNGQVQPRGAIKDRIDLKIAIDYGYNFHAI